MVLKQVLQIYIEILWTNSEWIVECLITNLGMSGKVFPFKLDIGSQESVDEAYKFVVSKLPVIRGKIIIIN